MADELKIVIKAILDEQDLKTQSKGIKGVEIPGRIVIDKADLKKQIDSVAGESANIGNRFKIKYGVDKADFVKQFRDAGMQAKKEIEKAVGASGGIQIQTKIGTDAANVLRQELSKVGINGPAVQSVTKELEKQKITVDKIETSYQSVAEAQTGLQSITLKGIDGLQRQVTLVQKFNAETQALEKTQIRVSAKLNEQGEIVGTMPTKLRAKDTETIRAEEVEVLKRFTSNVQQANQYSGEMKNTVDALGVSLSNAFAEPELKAYQNQLGIAQQQFRALKAEADRLAASPVTKIDKNTGALNQTLAYQGMDAQTAGVTALRGEITSLVGEYGRLKVSMDGLDPSSAEFQNLATQVDALDTRFKSASKAAEIFNGSFGSKTKLAGANEQIRKATSSLDELETKWSKFQKNPALVAEFNELRDAAKGLDTLSLQNFNKQLASFKTNVRAAGADTRSFGDELKNAFAKFGIWITASTIFMQAWRGVRQMVDSVKELDAALVEFNKVADLSNTELSKFVDRAFEAGKALGRTGTDVLAASAIFKQAGYDVEESLSLAKSSLMMMNVGDGIDSAARASSDLIAVLKGFQLEVGQSQMVLDALNNTSNNTAIGFGELSEGVSRAAGTLSQSGTTLQETMGLLVGGFSSLRNIEKVSSGLVMISQRMRAVTEDGEAIEGLVPKLESAFQELVGVSVMGDNGELRSTYDLLSDLQNKWDSLTSSQQQYIGSLVSGNRQITVLNALMRNWGDTQEGVAAATNSAGSALKENEKFLGGIEGRMNTLSSAFQMLSQNTVNSGLIKFIVDFATKLTTLVDSIGMIPALLTGLSLFTSLFAGNKFSGLINGFTSGLTSIPAKIKTIRASISGASGDFSKFGKSMTDAGMSVSKLQLGVLAVTAAYSIGKLFLDKYNNGIKEQSQKAKEFVDSWKESRETLAQTKETLDDIGGEFEKLGQGVDAFGNNISLTTDEFNKYHQITNQIAGMFPELRSGYDSQGNAILAVKSSVEELNKAYEAQIALMNTKVLKEAPTVFEETKKAYSEGYYFYDDTSLTGKRGNAQKLLDDLNSGGKGITAPVTDSSITALAKDMGELANYSDNSITKSIKVKPEDVVAAKQFISAELRVIDSEITSLAGERKSIISAYLFGETAYQNADEQIKSIVDYVVANLDNEFVMQQKTPSSMKVVMSQAVLEPLTTNDGLAKTIAATAEAGDSFKQSEKSISDYTAAYTKLQDVMRSANLGGQVVDAVNKSMIDPKVYDPLKTNIKDKLSDEFDYMVDSMMLSELKLGAALEVPEGVLLTWDEYRKRIDAAKKTLTALTLTENVAALKTAAEVANGAFEESAYFGSISAEGYKKLADLGGEYAATVDSTNGYLTVNKQKLDALIASQQEETRAQIAYGKSQKLSEYESNAIQISESKLLIDDLSESTKYSSEQIAEWTKQLVEKNEVLENSQEGIRKEINAYDILASELNYATSAYKRWLDAKNAPEAGDGYDELSVARKAIEEGLESGKIGTSKYLAATGLLIPDSINPKDKEAVDNYLESMGKYLTEDSSGLETYVNDLYAKGFLADDGNGNYYATEKANIQDIAKELKITEEAARLMFSALNDYGATFQISDNTFDSSAAIQQIDSLTAKLTDAQKKYDELIASGASAKDIQDQKAIVDDANAQLESAKGSSLQIPVELTIEEQLDARLKALELLIAEWGKIGIPAELSLDAKTEAANIQTQLDAITAAKAIIATATANLDTKELEKQILALKNPNDENGDPKTPLQLSIDAKLTEAYTAALKTVNDDIAKVEGATPTVTPSADPLPFNDEMDTLQNGPYTATIVIGGNADEFKKKVEEAKLWWEQNKPEGSPPLSTQFGGTGGVDQEAINAYLIKLMEQPGLPNSGEFAGQVLMKDTFGTTETVEVPAKLRLDPDTEEVLIADLNLKEPVEVPLDLDTISGATTLADFVGDIKYANPEVSVGANVLPGLTAANDLVDDINSKEAVIDVKVKSPGGWLPNIKEKWAKGTKHAKKGVALTGEEGVETVLTKDGFYTVGHDGPELTNLKGGEEILTADETKKIFKRRGKRTSGQAFENGTIKSGLTNIWNGITNLFKPATDEIVKGFKAVTGGISNVFGGNNKSKGGGKGKTPTVNEEDLVDWIPTLLDRLQKHTEKIIEQSESLVQYTAQNAKLDEAINTNTESLNANNSAYARYIQQAESVAQKGLSGDILDKIKNGVVDIQAYDEATRKLISDYKKWNDLAQGTLDTVSELNKKQKELATQKLGNVQQYYENRIGSYANNVDLAQSAISLGQATGREIRATDYDGIFADLQKQLGILREERAVYEETFNALVSSGVIEQGSNEWFDYTGNINSMDKAITDASISLDDFNDIADSIPVKNLDIAIKYLNTVQSTLESVQGLREAQGNVLGTLDYEQLISVGMQQIATLQAQNDQLKDQRDGLDVLSDEYQEIQDKIDGNLSSIWDIKTTQENWNDAIIDLDIAKLQEVNDKYDSQLRTMEAIEGLEKAKQRRSLVYHEGKGFGYEADQSEVKTAQREYDNVMFENLIDTLEGLKKDDNVYDSTGNLIGKQFTTLDNVDFSKYLSTAIAGQENSALLKSAIGQIDYNVLKSGGAKSNAVSFNGDIILHGVNDVQGLAEALKVELPSYIAQLWFSK